MTNLTPTRRGRCAGMQDWRAQYRALRMTGEEAAAQIRDGDVLVFSPLTNWPREVDAAPATSLPREAVFWRRNARSMWPTTPTFSVRSGPGWARETFSSRR